MPHEVDSPEKRGEHPEYKCFSMIRFLVYRDQVMPPIREFDLKADKEYTKWVNKPKAERGVVPEVTRSRPKPVTPIERAGLLKLLFDLLFKKSEEIKHQHAASPLSWRKSSRDENGETPKLDDSPVPFPNLKQDSKRARDELAAKAGPSKKVKTPEKTKPFSTKSTNDMLPPPRGRSDVQYPQISRSANTSFESNTTSIFSNASQSFNRSGLLNTQETVPDIEEPNIQAQEDLSSVATHETQTSSEFGVRSSFEAALADSFNAAFAETSNPKGLDDKPDIPQAQVDKDSLQGLIKTRLGDNADVITSEDILQERLGDVFGR